jgi:hypothetical protein
MAIQTIKRSVTIPQVSVLAEDWFRRFIYKDYTQLTQQTNAMLTGLAQYQSGTAAFPAITGGNTSKVLTFTTPFTDTLYSASALPDWSTTVYFSAKLKTSITINFGTAAPGNQNCLVLLMR